MSTTDFLIFWAVSFACIAAFRVVPALVLHGRELSPRVAEALGYIPPAVFAALVANDLVSADMFASGVWPAVLPFVASVVVGVVAYKTRSMIWCCIVGIVCYVVLSLI